MNSHELIRYIFEGVEDEISIFDGPTDDEMIVKVSEIPDPLPYSVPCVDFRIDTKTVGVQVDSPETATFSLCNAEGDWLHVALFEIPQELDDLPEEAEIFDCPVGGDWAYEEGTGIFYSVEAVFPVSSDDTENDNDTETDLEGEAPAGDDGAGDADAPASSAPAKPAAEADAEVERLNDADMLGEDHPEMEELLGKQATMLVGEMWGAKDRRNTQDEKWKAPSMSWLEWIVGGPATANTAAWGFSRHPEGKHKEGICNVLGSSIGGARKAKAMDQMYAMGIDIDSGVRMSNVLDKIKELGLFALVYTSFNNGKSGLSLKRDDVMRKLQITRDPSIEDVRLYLKEFDKNRYEDSFIAEISIKDSKKQTKEGVVILLDTPPLEKFRLIFPLKDPVKLIDLAETQQAALDIWEDKITGLAVSLLGVHFDTSCTDPSRLFYTGRHPKDGEYYAALVKGRPLTFSEVPTYRKSAYTASRGGTDPWSQAGGAADGNELPPEAVAPSGMSLNDWHRRAKDRFMLADLLDTYCADRIRDAGGEKQGTVHVECPFEHEHSSEGGTACMAVNAIDSSSDYWSWWCHHDACQGRHKLQFLEEAMRQEWFEESLLTGDEFLLPADDEEEEEEPDEEPALEGTKDLTPEERAAQFTDQDTEEDIKKFLKRLFREGIDDVQRGNVFRELAKVTSLGKRDLSKYWREFEKARADRDKKAAEKDLSNFTGAALVGDWGFHRMCDYAWTRIKTLNTETPTLFHYMDKLAMVEDDREGRPMVTFLDKDRFMRKLNEAARFEKPQGDDGGRLEVSAPHDVVTYVFNGARTQYPALRGLVSTPTFVKGGKLLSKEGYDPESKLYYSPDANLVLPSIPSKPTEEDVFEAKRLLIEDILADFPLGALTRPEIEEQALHGTGVAAVSNMLALMILPFCRELIDGPTPGHLLTKPAPGTGASLLTDTFSIIADGKPAAAMALPTNKDEMSKTLTSVLADSQNIVFFDNINHSVDSGELASAMTAPTYRARILGTSQTVEVDVRCAWVFTGNNVTLSGELVRRLVMIDLDAEVPRPELRTNFRHGDIRGWATENRGKLVAACLTLIQNWVAQGMPMQNEQVMASYENWSRIMGGILKAAGIGEFMTNRGELQNRADDSEEDGINILLETWWDKFGTQEVFIKGGDKAVGIMDVAVAEDLNLPIKKSRTADGDMTYDSVSFGKFLGRYKGKVFELEDGSYVVLNRKDGKRHRLGSQWFLNLKTKTAGNVSA